MPSDAIRQASGVTMAGARRGRMRALRWGLAFLAVVIALLPLVAVPAAPEPQQEQKQEYDRLAPFEAVRWKQGAVEVDLGGIGYELLEIQDLPISKVLDYCREHYKPEWRKAFEEQ